MSRVMSVVGRMFGWLLGRQFWIFLGLLGLACLIWMVGPLVAVGPYRPLESTSARAWSIAALFAFWLLRVLFRAWRAARLNSQLLNQIRTPASATQAAKAEVDPQMAVLRERFDQAMERLRTARFAEQGGAKGWFARFSRQYLYQLPWYVFIGAPGSGKTTALVNSGLEFPLADQFGKAAVRGVGGTRHCDWWFTNEAVLIDTAGRYTMQESNREQDQREWRNFVDLLKRFRPKQALNGAILTISVSDLLGASDAERAEHALTLRKRLQEMRDELGIALPVYVLVTKVDLLAGFSEYFAQLDREERAQVWGFTFPHAAPPKTAQALNEAFAGEYGQLVERLYAGLPERLISEHDPRARELSYLLPQEFAGLQELLAQFIAQVFVESRFEIGALLRGVYFTSGTQEGTVFERVMGGIKRSLKIEGTAYPPQAGEPGRSFFLRDLMQSLIFREAGLAGANEGWQRRQTWTQRAGFAALAVVAALFAIGSLVSYRNNARYLDEIAARLPGVQAQIAAVKLGDRAAIQALLPALDWLRRLPESHAFAKGDVPFSYGFGLFQGRKLEAAAEGAYERALEDALLPLLARRMEDALRAPPEGEDPEYTYNALKAYLMLYDASHYDAEFLQVWLALDIQHQSGNELTRAQREALDQDLARLFGAHVVGSPYAKNEPLVAQVREGLLRHTLAERSYLAIKRTQLARATRPEFNVAAAVGPQATLVFRRASGASLNHGVPGLYSYRGYWEDVAPRVEQDVARRSREETWVLGLPAPDIGSQEALLKWSHEVRRLYLSDYIAAWDAFLSDLRLRSGADLAENIQITRALSAKDSPLVRLMSAASAQTSLLREGKDDERNLIEQAREKMNETRASLESLFGGATAAPMEDTHDEQMVDSHFAGLRDFTQSPEQGTEAPIAGVRDTLNELYTQLTATDAALRSGNPPPPDATLNKVRADAGRMPSPFRDMLTDLASTTDTTVNRVMRSQVGANAAASIGDFCREATAGRYPVVRNSSRDMTQGDFAQLFAPGGLMDDFFQKQLAQQVDTSVKPWRFKGEDKARAAYLADFEKAAVVRDVFFNGGARTPSIRVELKPVQMDAGIAQATLDVDGQVLRYAHGPQVPTQIQWPGSRGSNQVRLQVSGVNGTINGFVTEGPWALLRLFDRASLAPGSVPEQMLASFDVGGSKVVFQVTANSVRSPFRLGQLESFSCPGRS